MLWTRHQVKLPEIRFRGRGPWALGDAQPITPRAVRFGQAGEIRSRERSAYASTS